MTQRRYKILCAKKVTDSMDAKQATAIVLEEIASPDQYRLGASKVLARLKRNPRYNTSEDFSYTCLLPLLTNPYIQRA